MGRFEIDRRGAVGFECRFPARDANAPLVPGIKSGKSPFRNGRDQNVAVEHRKIEYLAEKSGHRIATTTLQFGSKNVGWHFSVNHWLFSRNGSFAFALPERLLNCAPRKHRALHALRKFSHTAHHLKVAKILWCVVLFARHQVVKCAQHLFDISAAFAF